MAVSVLGRIGTQAALAAAGPSSRTGLTLTTSTPARPSAAIQPPTECSPQPPLATCMFFGLAPPNSTTRLAWRGIDDREGSGAVTAWAEQMTVGRNFSAVPKL